MLDWSVTGVMAERGNEERRIVEVIEEPGTRRDSIPYTTNDGHFFFKKDQRLDVNYKWY
jgi:hypothetical protein